MPDDVPEGHGEAIERFRFHQTLSKAYTEPPRESDYELSAISRGGGDQVVDETELEFEQVVSTAKVLAHEYRRFDAARFLYQYWSSDETPTHGDFNTELAMLGVEHLELLIIFRSGQEHTALIRLCSFLQPYLVDKINNDPSVKDINPDAKFAHAIMAARKRGIIAEDKECLYHFIREVQNECSHNAWLTSNIRMGVLRIACECGIYVLLHQIASEEGIGSGDYMAGTSMSELLQIIQNDWNWTLDESNGNIEWTPPTNSQ